MLQVSFTPPPRRNWNFECLDFKGQQGLSYGISTFDALKTLTEEERLETVTTVNIFFAHLFLLLYVFSFHTCYFDAFMVLRDSFLSCYNLFFKPCTEV